MTIQNTLYLSLLLPFLGTALGAGTVFCIGSEMGKKLQNALLGFASGVMIAASVWSLLIPAIEMAEEQGNIAWLPAALGFLSGILFLLFFDNRIDRMRRENDRGNAYFSRFGKSFMLVFAVTLHNIPEGMAVGVVLSAMQSGNISATAALALSLGIAIQNFPEGAVVSAPLRSEGMSRRRSFLYGTLSGAVEPIASVATLLLTYLIAPILPGVLSFAAGAMIYVVVEELIPETQNSPHATIGTLGTAIGFVLMMVLDVALG